MGRNDADNEEKVSVRSAATVIKEMALFVWGFLSEAFVTLAAATVEHVRHEWRPKNRKNVISRYFMGFIIFYYEIVFKLSTTRTPLGLSFFYIFLYSIAWGLIAYFFTTFLKPKKNRIARMILIFLMAIPFLVEYFVYLQFKVLYDLNTVTNGAGGVLTGFMGDVVRLVFSLSGLSHIFFFLLPFLLYTILFNRIDPAKRIRIKRRIRTVLVVIGIFFFTWLLVLINGSTRRVYRKEYDFQSAVGNFGLYTGLRLEIRNNIFGNKVSFEAESTDTAEEETAADEPVVYGDNALKIDFNALAESASGTDQELDSYVATLTPSKQNEYTGLFKGKNLIMITAEAFSGDIIDQNLTPTLYRLANRGIKFTDYYMQATAGTTGGEYEHIFGMLPTDGGKSMMDTENFHNLMTMGSQLNRLGYYGKMYHNNDYTYYHRDVTHYTFGYSDGYTGYGNGLEDQITKQWPESDLEMFQATLPQYIDKEPFNIYYMTVSGHSSYTYDANAMARKNWDAVKDMEYTEPVKAYIAANLELENGLTWLVNELEAAGKANDTVICLTADHFPYGLDNDAALGNMPYLSELYGYDVVDYLHRDHNTLIIWSGALESMDPIVVNTPVSAIDILPTLSNLFGTEYDSRLFPGRDVFSDAEPLMFNLSYDGKTELGTYSAADGTFTPLTDSTVVPDDYVDRIKKIVRNKINYMTGFLKTDYFGHVFENYTFSDEKVVREKEVYGPVPQGIEVVPVTPEGAEPTSAAETTQAAEEGGGEEEN